MPRYHVTVNPPAPGSAKGLIASGLVNGHRWRIVGLPAAGTPGACFGASAPGDLCDETAPPRASRSGDPATFAGGIKRWPLVPYGSVRRDVAYLRVGLTNGQVLRLRPVPVFGRRYARHVAFAVPYATTVTRIWAYSGHSELGYAVPYTRGDGWRRRVGCAPASRPCHPPPVT